MLGKVPIQVRAAAELELRRRHRERAESCYMCDTIETINRVYSEIQGIPDDGRPAVCTHTKEEADIDSRSNQKYIAELSDIYDPIYVDGVSNNV